MATRTDGPADAAPTLAPALVDFVHSGVIMHLATRDAELVPAEVIACGALVGPSRDTVTVFVAENLAGTALRNVRDNGQLALTMTRVTDNRSVQLKGTVLRDRPATEEERERLAVYREAFTRELGLVGLPRSVCARLVWWPAVALDVRLREVFDQTPGPAAGRPWAAGARP